MAQNYEMRVVHTFEDIKEYYGDLLAQYDWYYSKYIPYNDGKIIYVILMYDSMDYVIIRNIRIGRSNEESVNE